MRHWSRWPQVPQMTAFLPRQDSPPACPRFCSRAWLACWGLCRRLVQRSVGHSRTMREAAPCLLPSPPSPFRRPRCHDPVKTSPGQYRRYRQCSSSSLPSDIPPRRFPRSKPTRRRRLRHSAARSNSSQDLVVSAPALTRLSTDRAETALHLSYPAADTLQQSARVPCTAPSATQWQRRPRRRLLSPP
jgi:hypothetical protein